MPLWRRVETLSLVRLVRAGAVAHMRSNERSDFAFGPGTHMEPKRENSGDESFRQLFSGWFFADFSGERAAARTQDLLIISQLLYRLSYALPKRMGSPSERGAEHK